MKIKTHRNYLYVRLDQFGKQLAIQDIDIAIITNPENIFYLSGFNPILYSHPLALIAGRNREAILYVHSLRFRHAESSTWIKEIICYGLWGDIKSISLDYYDGLIKLINSSASVKTNKIGLEFNYISHNEFEFFKNNFKNYNYADITPILQRQRAVKDVVEVDLIKKAAEISTKAMHVAYKSIYNNESEAEVSKNITNAMYSEWINNYADYEVSSFGSRTTGLIFGSQAWCLMGSRISYGCDCPSPTVFPTDGEFILPIIWSNLGGYYAENERTLYKGQISEYKESLFNTMLEARQKVIEAIKPDITLGTLYSIAEKCFIKNNLGQFKPGRIGHGIGISPHEWPSISPHSDITLEENMILTIEPGMMNLDWGGVRHSDTIIVTATGVEIITNIGDEDDLII